MNKFTYKLLLLIIIFLGAFYWFEWRPSSIRSNCMEQSVPANIPKDWHDYDNTKNIFEIGDYIYKNCIRLHGLKN